MPLRRAAAVAVGALIGVTALPGAAAAAPDPVPTDCRITPGGTLATPWAQNRLGFRDVWPITRGTNVRTGRPVLVGVIDSGFDPRHPQLRRIDAAPPYDALTRRTVDPGSLVDCVGHGTAVTSIIAAQPSADSAFTGVAPDARILPIKYTNAADGSSAALARAIDYAVSRHVQVLNISTGVVTPGPTLLPAVQRAAAAGVVVVAAAGNDAQNTSAPNVASYPAAWSSRLNNVIAVSATDAGDSVGSFATRGAYVDVAAPGSNVAVAARVTGYSTPSGTSFAAPFVAGTVALMLGADPGLHPDEVRNRLESTADQPPAEVPDPRYGYGIINPLLAVTAVSSRPAASASPVAAAPLPAPVADRAPDRHVAHLALGIAIGLLGAGVLAAAAAAVLRATRRQRRPAGPTV